MPRKRCIACGQSKPLNAFYAHPAARDGHQGTCATCVRAYQHAHRAQERAAYRARQQAQDWTTADELAFVQYLGTHRATLLQTYRANLALRQAWGAIDQGAVRRALERMLPPKPREVRDACD